MNAVFRAVVSAGPVVFGVALILLPVYYVSWRSAPAPKQHLSAARYVLASLGAGALAFVAGTAAGIWAACSAANAGNLCGLVGFFGVGPLLSGVAMWSCAHLLVRHARRPPGASPGIT